MNKLVTALPFGRISTLLLAFLVGCITVNVYFPEGAVQRAADEFVKDLYKTAPQQNGAKPGAKNETTPPTSMLDLLIPTANAADEINISTPEAMAIKSRMSGRVAQISTFKAKGIVGEASNGTVVVKDASSLALKDRSTVERLVAAENGDRQALYDEVQKANNLASDRGQVKIRSYFSKAFQEHSPAGTWVQGQSGGWSRK